jgi:hypothetical protein
MGHMLHPTTLFARTPASGQLSLTRDCRPLSAIELAAARRICDEAIQSVVERPEFMRHNAIDEKFALPDANWSYDSSNEFVQLFRRIAAGATADLNLLRRYMPVFTGFHLHEVLRSDACPEIRVHELAAEGDIDAELAIKLAERNPPYLARHRALVAGLPRAYVLQPPLVLGEVGHLVDGVLVNHDTVVYQERINLFHRCGLLDAIARRVAQSRPVRICEIGGGYGALCRWFKTTFPDVSYTIIDLPESLLFSRLYVALTLPTLETSLGLTEPENGVRFVPNYMAEELCDSFDVIINTLSMSEMSDHQVRKYARLMHRSWLKPDGVFFEQNHDNRHVGLGCAQEILSTMFSHHHVVSDAVEAQSQGNANLWSINPLV